MKTVIEETETICSLCGGRGQEYNTQTTAMFTTCRSCQGRGYIVTSRTTRTVIEPDPSVGSRSPGA